MAESRQRPNAPSWVKALVFLHLFAITVWTLPTPPTSLLVGKAKPSGTDLLLVANQRYLKSIEPLQAYVSSTGMWQYWDMFAPNPSTTDVYCTAEVLYSDGTVRAYKFPRIAETPIVAKYSKERYRKYFERAHLDASSFMWPDFAQRIALVNASDPSNPPTRVRLHLHSLDVAPPGYPQSTQYVDRVFFEGVVDQVRLAKEAKWR